MSVRRRATRTSPRFMPLRGALVGAIGAGVYWSGTQFWPASIAVVLAMLAMALLCAVDGDVARARVSDPPSLGSVFALLMKYNALMALSAANLPYHLPANLALGVIMIAGLAASSALVVSVLASRVVPASAPATFADLGVALVLGFAPAALIGLPGLVGLVAAIVARVAFVACLARMHRSIAAVDLGHIRQLTEVCFYLGALAAWAYI